MIEGSASPSGQACREQTPTLEELIDGIQPVPPQTCVVGLCEDRIPFLLDLSQPETGSLLVTGDPACGKTAQLQLLVESVMQLNSPNEVKVGVLSRHPEDWTDQIEDPRYARHFLGIFSWYESDAADLVVAWFP